MAQTDRKIRDVIHSRAKRAYKYISAGPTISPYSVSVTENTSACNVALYFLFSALCDSVNKLLHPLLSVSRDV